jgi:hypothetical protein
MFCFTYSNWQVKFRHRREGNGRARSGGWAILRFPWWWGTSLKYFRSPPLCVFFRVCDWDRADQSAKGKSRLKENAREGKGRDTGQAAREGKFLRPDNLSLWVMKNRRERRHRGCPQQTFPTRLGNRRESFGFPTNLAKSSMEYSFSFDV